LDLLRLRAMARAVAMALTIFPFESSASAQDPESTRTDESLAEIEFDSAFFPRTAGGKLIDVSHFARGNPVYPGTYRVGLTVNGNPGGEVEVMFSATKDPLHAAPCFGRALLQQMGLDFSKLTLSQLADINSPGACMRLTDWIAESSVDFDSSDLQMSVTIPQVFMRRTSRGYVDPALWSEGVNAGLLNYNFNAYRSSYSGEASTDLYLGLNTGINIGRWRLRHNGSFSSNIGAPAHYQSTSTYAEYAIVPWKSEIKIGDGYSDGTVFDSFGFRGVNLASDDRMLPDTQRGFAPVVRGIALSNAKVTVNQNGNLLYETTVPPGPFEINDLYATGYGGDLDVVVTEANGTRRSFAVPYSSVPQALRPGVYRYSVTAGQYRDESLRFGSNVLAATYQRGLTNIVTLYGGVQFADRYGSAALGAALNTQFGALSGDVTMASTELPGQSRQTGQSYQIRFAKAIPQTDTNLTVAAYRYSTSGYLSLSDAMISRDYALGGQPDWNNDREKARLQLTISQEMGQKWGSVYLTGQSQNYWNRGNSDASFQFGYTNHIARVFYNASVSRTRVVTTGLWDNRFFVSFTVPLGSSSSTASLTTNVSYSDTDRSSQVQTSLSGTVGEHNEFSYNVSSNYDRSNTGSSVGGNASGNYASSVGTFGASVGAGKNSQQYSLSLNGGAIVHADGLTFGPPLGGTNAIVEAKGAAGAYINGVSSNRINGFGYGIVPSLTPYSVNRIEIDPKGLPLDVELKTTGQDIVPLAGAVLKARFETDTQRTIIVKATHADGTPLAFASEVTRQDGSHVGYVSQGGRILAKGVEETDQLLVKWGSEPGESCTMEIRVNQQETVICR
jgi:outer membrane usher protein